MPYIHPVFEGVMTLLALWVLYLGVKRVRAVYLKHKIVFPWKKHVLLGSIALSGMLFGMIGGTVIVYRFHGQLFLLKGHGPIAIVMLPLILFGLISGAYMNRVKAARKWLPLFHGLANLAVVVFAFAQVFTGLQLLSK